LYFRFRRRVDRLEHVIERLVAKLEPALSKLETLHKESLKRKGEPVTLLELSRTVDIDKVSRMFNM